MKQIYLIIALLTILTIGILSINSAGIITFAQEKNETSEMEDSPLITTPELEESIKTNNDTSSYENDDNTSMIEKILP
jgi:hypothetical protein